jgi:hypothetical protein
MVCCVLGGIELDFHSFTVATITEIVKRVARRFLMGSNVGLQCNLSLLTFLGLEHGGHDI